MSKVIVAATPLAGHTSPMLQIAAALVTAGHEVTFLGGERYTGSVKEAGAQMVALTGKADYDDRRFDEFFPNRASTPPGPPQLNLDLRQVFGDPLVQQHLQLQALLAQDPEQTLITDLMFLGAWPSALGVGLRPRRWISLAMTPLYVASVDTSMLGPVPVEPGGDQAAANLAATAAFDAMLEPGFSHVRDLIAGLGGDLSRVTGYIATAYSLPDIVAQPTVPELEFPRSDLPEHITYVGPLPMTTVDAWTPPSWWSELGSRPVVAVTQGTLSNHDLSSLVEPTLTALADEDVLVVVALGGRAVDEIAEKSPANARVESFVPFDRLLPHADVLVTNGGYGGVQVSLAAGCPVVVAGTTEDKPATAARVTYSGTGVDLGTDTPAPEQIRDAVRAILADPGYQERVDAMREAYSRYDSLALIVAMVERA
ncbi:nucleotide disphospho-sugar-binding domain-containing protein [Kineosporia sp. NBRC 101731]|uniref:glycosyltransferase n=1 Tax=Kineosporia sp. NBRC 101731 TaxID=3032199 RepID=UPI0024A5F931|nr:nucleotide disphospho-sugar-binding domain-containing protein [Kineosporia sp. NBRC 101731]GLY29191.1 glycosyl transferase [Kineosporia sp. NBRC 101731]